MIPIRTDYRMTRTPWVNYALVAANIGLFVMGLNGLGEVSRGRINAWMLHPDLPHVYQFFSSAFLHANWGHLLGNMVFLWVFGNALNDRLGHVGYLAFYLAGAVLAGVGYVVFSANAPVLGASGAIAAVTGAYLVLFPRVRVTVLVFFYIITYFEISSVVFLGIQFVWNMVMSAQSTLGKSTGGVAYVAHSAGYVFGIAMAGVLLATRLVPRDAFDLLNLIRNARRRWNYRRMVAQGQDPFSPTQGVRPGAGPAGSGRFVRRVETIQTPAESEREPDSPAARELRLRREISEACGRHTLSEAASKYLQLVQIAEGAVLPRQQQLDVANQLMASDQHAAAADAYERFLKHHATYEHIADIYLMLGLLYSRYLHEYGRAERLLTKAVEQLDDASKVEMARADLQRIRGRG
jgi:membrane associated rhomboid family serine protease